MNLWAFLWLISIALGYTLKTYRQNFINHGLHR